MDRSQLIPLAKSLYYEGIHLALFGADNLKKVLDYLKRHSSELRLILNRIGSLKTRLESRLSFEVQTFLEEI